jgi:hypothetical protein
MRREVANISDCVDRFAQVRGQFAGVDHLLNFVSQVSRLDLHKVPKKIL